jgi:hypothetical protein
MKVTIKILDPAGVEMNVINHDIPFAEIPEINKGRPLRNVIEIGEHVYYFFKDGLIEKIGSHITPEREKEIRELCQKKIQSIYKDYLL